MRKILFLTSLFVFASFSCVWAEDVSGNWGLTMIGPHGEENWDLVITVKSKDLTIIAKHPNPLLGDLTGTGKLNGDNITMNIASSGQKVMVHNFDFKGTVKGNKMSGTGEISRGDGTDFRSFPSTWTAEMK